MICPAETQVELRAPGHSQSGGGGHELGLAIRGKCKASLELALPGHRTPGPSASATLSCAQALRRLNGSRKDPGLAPMRA